MTTQKKTKTNTKNLITIFNQYTIFISMIQHKNLTTFLKKLIKSKQTKKIYIIAVRRVSLDSVNISFLYFMG